MTLRRVVTTAGGGPPFEQLPGTFANVPSLEFDDITGEFYVGGNPSQSSGVSSVAGKTGAVSLVESDIGNLVSDLAAKAPLANPVFQNNITVNNAVLTAATYLRQTSGNPSFVALQTDGNFGEYGADVHGLFIGLQFSSVGFNDWLYLKANYPSTTLSQNAAAGTTVLNLAAPLNVGTGTHIQLGVSTPSGSTQEWVTYVSGTGTSTITVSALAFAHNIGETVAVTDDTTHLPEWRIQGNINQNMVGGSLGFSSGSAVIDAGISRVSAGLLAVGNGTPGDASGTINAAVFGGGVHGAALVSQNGFNFYCDGNSNQFSINRNTQTGAIGINTLAAFILRPTSSTEYSIDLYNGSGSYLGTPFVLDAAFFATPTVKFTTALVTLGGGATPTLGTIGGSGPASAAQNSWLLLKDSTGASFWVPAWK